MSSLQFNAILLEISNQISSGELNDLKFLCRDDIGKRDMEKIASGRKLFEFLTERRKLAADNTEYLCQLFRQINRVDLSDKLNSFEYHDVSIGKQPSEEERAKLDIATEVIAKNLGRSWRALGRKLGLTEVKLESIAKRHPTELEETAVELLKEWRKYRGAEARTEELVNALRVCQYNLTADKLEFRLRSLGY